MTTVVCSCDPKHLEVGGWDRGCPTHDPAHGLCACGCGERTPVSKYNRRRLGHVKGQPVKYVNGHNGRRDLRERFWEKVDKTSSPTGCWLWTGAIIKGYGSIKVADEKRSKLAHRVSYEWARGPIPDGLTIDHLCRTTACVNPMHLEAVTSAVNTLRGTAFSAVNARKTHCLRDHPFDAVNTYVDRRGARHCRACRRVDATLHDTAASA